MFTWRHIVWLIISIVFIVYFGFLIKRKNISLDTVLSYACIGSLVSEAIKVFSVLEFVPSEDGSIIFPYMGMNHLPLHLCSLQILMLHYVKYTSNLKMREKVLSFMYPSCILGAISALLMPSIFSTSISVEQAFIHPLAYQFFFYHSMLIIVGIAIISTKEIKWEKRHYFDTLKITYILGFISLYINSIFASPTYLNGKLLHVDFWPNFFFTYNNPLGIKISTIQQWYLYLLILIVVVAVLITLFYIPLLRKKKN